MIMLLDMLTSLHSGHVSLSFFHRAVLAPGMKVFNFRLPSSLIYGLTCYAVHYAIGFSVPDGRRDRRYLFHHIYHLCS